MGFIVPVNGASVLGPHIGALAVQCRRIMGRKEHVQKIGERKNSGVECDLHDLSMSSTSSTNLPISWVLDVASCVARNPLHHSRDGFIHRLNAPKTPRTEGNGFKLRLGHRRGHGKSFEEQGHRYSAWKKHLTYRLVQWVRCHEVRVLPLPTTCNAKSTSACPPLVGILPKALKHPPTGSPLPNHSPN